MPSPLDVELHVKYIQNLDEVRSFYSGWDELASSPTLRWLSEKRLGIPFNRTSPYQRGILGFDCVMYNGPERCFTKGWNGWLCQELLGWWSWWVLGSSTRYNRTVWRMFQDPPWGLSWLELLLTCRNFRSTSWSWWSYPWNTLCYPDPSDPECSG